MKLGCNPVIRTNALRLCIDCMCVCRACEQPVQHELQIPKRVGCAAQALAVASRQVGSLAAQTAELQAQQAAHLAWTGRSLVLASLDSMEVAIAAWETDTFVLGRVAVRIAFVRTQARLSLIRILSGYTMLVADVEVGALPTRCSVCAGRRGRAAARLPAAAEGSAIDHQRPASPVAGEHGSCSHKTNLSLHTVMYAGGTPYIQ